MTTRKTTAKAKPSTILPTFKDVLISAVNKLSEKDAKDFLLFMAAECSQDDDESCTTHGAAGVTEYTDNGDCYTVFEHKGKFFALDDDETSLSAALRPVKMETKNIFIVIK